MENQQVLSVSQKQLQQLSARQLQSLELLNLPLLELEERLSTELASNPVLEMERPEGDALPDPVAPPDESAASENSGDDDAWSADAIESGDWNEELPVPDGVSGHEDNELHDFLLNSVKSPAPSLQDQLEEELFITESVSPSIRRAAETAIGGIDERGYLTLLPADIAMAENLPLEDAEAAVKLIQSFDPPGIGARNLGECLKLQLERDGQDDPVLLDILDHHLEEIEMNRLPQLARHLGISVPELNEKIALLRKYNPFPGGALAGRPEEYVLPELEIVPDGEGHFKARGRENVLPRLYLAERYVKMLDNPHLSAADKTYLREKIQAARELMKSFDLRQSTIQRIADLLARTQEVFFRNGVEFLQPLTMRQVGDELKLHETTVSRAVANKYIETPRGVLPLKYFFSGGIGTENGEALSNRAVKEKIRALIETEDSKKPLSDDKIAQMLKADGLNIARRTVAKYRESMDIPPTNLRRKHI